MNVGSSHPSSAVHHTRRKAHSCGQDHGEPQARYKMLVLVEGSCSGLEQVILDGEHWLAVNVNHCDVLDQELEVDLRVNQQR